MGDKKHIDRVFQERFKDFEAKPNEAVWNNIASQLGQKKKRRIIPIWMQLGGVAAAILLLLALGYSQFRSAEGPIVNKNQLVQEKDKKSQEQYGAEGINNKTGKEKGAIEGIAQEAVTETNVSEDVFDENQIRTIKQKQLILEEGIVRTNTSKGTSKSTKAIVNNSSSNLPEILIDVADAKVEKSGVNSSELIKNPNEDTSLASTSTTKNNAIVKQDALRKSNATKLPNLIKEANKPSVNNSIVENEPSKQATDEVKINLEDALAENNTEAASEKDEKSTDKWQINTMLAPVYYNSIGEGSPIDAQFKDNAKQGDINLSYGLNIAYRLSNKISLRSGVNKVNLGYETQDISYQASFEGGDLATVNYTSTAANITVSDKPALSANTANSSNDELFVSASTARNGLGTAGTMNQQLAYIEVPLELTFKLVDSKLGVNLIGGMSTLFLTDNSITLESANLITDMGEANNINDLSFSTNIGLGFDYKVSSHLHFNLEPMFKYQLNAFSSDSGNFKPYYLGVYTGFSYKF
jgi:hypothetical protein